MLSEARFLLLLLRLDFDPKNEREPFEDRGLKKTLPPILIRLGALLEWPLRFPTLEQIIGLYRSYMLHILASHTPQLGKWGVWSTLHIHGGVACKTTYYSGKPGQGHCFADRLSSLLSRSSIVVPYHRLKSVPSLRKSHVALLFTPLMCFRLVVLTILTDF